MLVLLNVSLLYGNGVILGVLIKRTLNRVRVMYGTWLVIVKLGVHWAVKANNWCALNMLKSGRIC